MFIREDIRKIKGKIYKYHRLVENRFTEKGSRQKTILSFGTLNLPRERWNELVELIEDCLYGQEHLIPPDEKILAIAEIASRKIRRNKRLKGIKDEDVLDVAMIKVNAVKASEAKELGTVYVGYEMLKRLNMDKIFLNCGLSLKQRDIAIASILCRLIHPVSEHLSIRWIRRSALADLMNRDFEGINEDVLYRISDKLYRNKEEIEEGLGKEEERLFNLSENIVLYDLTSTYFEGLMKRSIKAERGYSRDKRKDCKQVIVGLVLDEEGFAKGHAVYEGNRQDTKGIVGLIEKLKRRTKKEKEPTVIVDRGIGTEDNLKKLREIGLKYIVATRQRELKEWDIDYEEIEFETIETRSGLEVSLGVKEKDGELYILCKSELRKKKEERIWLRFKEDIEEALERLSRRIVCGRLRDEVKIYQSIGRIKERYRKVSKYYHIELKGSKEEGYRLYYELDKEKEEKREIFEGRYILRTNRDDLTKEEIWKLYIMLTRVENGFKNLKADLGIRPIYHHKDNRIEGHIFISVLAYHLLHSIEYILKNQNDIRTPKTLKEILISHQIVTVTMPDIDGKVHHLRLPTEADAEQQEIYKTLGIKDKPIKQRHIVIG